MGCFGAQFVFGHKIPHILHLLTLLFPVRVLFSESESCSVVSDSSRPTDYPVHGTLLTRILEWGAVPFLRGSSKPRSPTLQANSLPAEPPGKPMNTGVGSLSLLQGIFLAQESNQDLLHCRRILYQLSHQGQMS